MFYAPVCALVLVLGYNLLNTDSKMTDISIGKGLVLFSFICGFFSGRVIKFIDRLKDLVLPISDGSAGTAATTTTDSTGGDTSDTTGDNKTSTSTDPSNTSGGDTSTIDTTATTAGTTSTGGSTALIPAATSTSGTSTEVAVITQPDTATTTETAQAAAVTAADITVNVQLSQAASQSADGPDIAEGGFNNAVVTLQSETGGSVITLTPPANDQEGSFTAKDLPLGKYTLLATMAYKKANSIINLSANQTIVIANATESIDLPLDITPVNG
jgi:hypothetical protein